METQETSNQSVGPRIIKGGKRAEKTFMPAPTQVEIEAVLNPLPGEQESPVAEAQPVQEEPEKMAFNPDSLKPASETPVARAQAMLDNAFKKFRVKNGLFTAADLMAALQHDDVKGHLKALKLPALRQGPSSNEPTPAKRGGRPKGSKNKVKAKAVKKNGKLRAYVKGAWLKEAQKLLTNKSAAEVKAALVEKFSIDATKASNTVNRAQKA